jgi:hypothetical protein
MLEDERPKTIQIAQRIMELGHLFRGGISVGNVWHEKQNIFGSGYIDAHQTEQKAVHPRVMLFPAGRALQLQAAWSALSALRVKAICSSMCCTPIISGRAQQGCPTRDTFGPFVSTSTASYRICR